MNSMNSTQNPALQNEQDIGPNLQLKPSQAAELLQAPVSPNLARQMASIWRDLNNSPEPDEAARLCRRSVFILDNLGYADAEDYTNARNAYSNWFFNDRKKLIQVFQAEADRLDQKFNS